MGAPLELTGQIFGSLVVLRKGTTINKYTRWVCKCACGNEVEIRTNVLRTGKVQRCPACSRKYTTEILIENNKSRVLDLVGKRFGRLTVIKKAESKPDGRVRWLCKCDCGKEKIILGQLLRDGMTQSCGCLWFETMLKANTKHGYSRRGKNKSRLSNIHRGMIERCENKNSIEYHRYGARGIKICDEWHDLKIFADWAIANGYSDDLTLDRINNDGNYCPENCRWATTREQSNNKRNTVYVTIEGETLPLQFAAEKYNCPRYRIVNRLRAGYADLDLVKERL